MSASSKKYLRLVRALTLISCALISYAPLEVRADDTPQAEAAKKKRRSRSKRAKKEARKAARSGEASTKKPDRRPRKDDKAARAAAEQARGVDSEVIKEGDTSVKVMRFSGLSLEGRLKSPQLLYFVNRVHAEFDRPKLPHRSFMPELDRSTRKDPL